MARPSGQRYGQHFLQDQDFVQRIITAMTPRADDRVIEIGPGRGALTLPLLRAIGRLTAIELDSRLIPPLRRAVADLGHLQVIEADVLKTDLGALACRDRMRIVGNLPYYISSPIVFHCLAHAEAIRDMHFMLQKEVVERMTAGPGSKTYGRLSVMLQLACRVEHLFDVPPEAFQPPPAVRSAVVRLTPLMKSERLPVDATCLDIIVRAAFGKRRKTLANALRGTLDAQALRDVDVDPGVRAETLAPADFVRLARRLQARRLASHGTATGQSRHG